MHSYARRKRCRICGGENVVQFLDLGSMPPANAFLKQEDLGKPEQSFPLTVSFCKDCFLVQTQDVVSPEILFKDYVYMTSGSKPLKEHFQDLARSLSRQFKLAKNDLVVDIGSNDGTFLEELKSCSRVLGIEPAATMAEYSREKGIPTEEKFFTSKLADEIREREGKARIILAANVFAHIDELHDVCNGIEHLLEDDGVFIMEAHWVGNLIGEGGFDQIYHEHLCYFSVLALEHLLRRFGMKIMDVQFIPIHGESMRVFIKKQGSVNDSVGRAFAKERVLGLDSFATFRKFADKVNKNRDRLVSTVADLKAAGKKIAGYGAPAKGNTLLNFCRIGKESIEYISDATPLKQGLFTPGMHIPVVAPERNREERPDCMLLLAWNYASAILEQEKDMRRNGTKFIIPVPEVKIV